MSTFPGFRQLPRPKDVDSPPRSPQRVAPGSPRKRREFFEYSEEAGGDQTIEDFIYVTDPYRSTSIRPRYPLPMTQYKAPEDIFGLLKDESPLPKLRNEIRTVLMDHNVDFQLMKFRSLSKPEYPDNNNNDDFVTLMIYATIDDAEEKNQWSQARRAVRSLLQEHKIIVHVEILDPALAYQPSMFPIVPHDPYVKVYESFRDRMVTDVEAALRGSWTSMCLYKIGNTLETSEYAVVIMVLPFTIRDWQALKRQLYDTHMRGAASPAENITIHFIPGEVVVGDSKTPGIDQSHDLPASFPNMGCSIGVDGEWGGGTLGAYMNLHIGETRDESGTIIETARDIRGFVTNSHVTAPSDKALSTVIEDYHKHGVDWNTAPLGPLRTVLKYPAEADLVATKKSLSDGITWFTQNISECDRKIEEAEIMQSESAIHRNQLGRKIWADRLAIYQERKTLCDRLPLTLGRTLWASGRAMHDKNGTIDIAFVKIQGEKKTKLWNHCSSSNDLPKEGNTGLANHLALDFKEKYKDLEGKPFPWPTKMSHAFSDIIKGQWYFKTGRTTGTTSGICHGTESFCRMSTPEARNKTIYYANGTRSEYADHGYTTELIIMKYDCLNKKSTTQLGMSELGDSGAIYLDEIGMPAGLGFGGITGYCGPKSGDGTGYDPSDGINKPKGGVNVGTTYDASVGLVTRMSDIQEHLRMRSNAELGFCK